MHLADRGKAVAQRLLGARLAGRAGHRDDLRPGTRARRNAGLLERLQHVGHHDLGRVDAAERGQLVFGNDQHAGAGRHRRAGEIMAVERFARDREEGVAGLQRAGVDRDAANPVRHLSERPPADGFDQRRGGPQIAHAARSRSASRTSS